MSTVSHPLKSSLIVKVRCTYSFDVGRVTEHVERLRVERLWNSSYGKPFALCKTSIVHVYMRSYLSPTVRSEISVNQNNVWFLSGRKVFICNGLLWKYTVYEQYVMAIFICILPSAVFLTV